MPKQMAVINYQECNPKECEEGVCLAVLACPKKILRQEGKFEMPEVFATMCLGCGLCVQACPRKAILLI